MNLRSLKNKIIIGSWSWSGMYKTISKKSVINLIELCLENGFFEFDTSPSYKQSELILSQIKKKNKKIIINTKCGWSSRFLKSFKSEDLEIDINSSLAKFGNINVLQLHNPRNEIKDWDKILQIFYKYKKLGLIKYSGISLARNHYFPIKLLNRFDFIQDEFNLLRIDPIYKIKNYKNVLAARSVYANGILTDSFDINCKFLKSDHRSSWLKGERLKNILIQKKILESYSTFGISKFALDFVLSFPFFKKVIIGIRTKNQFHEFLKNINNFEKIERKKINVVLNLHKQNYYFSKSIYRYNN